MGDVNDGDIGDATRAGHAIGASNVGTTCGAWVCAARATTAKRLKPTRRAKRGKKGKPALEIGLSSKKRGRGARRSTEDPRGKVGSEAAAPREG